MNAFAYLFESITKVSEDFNKIEAFFETIATRFKHLHFLSERIAQIPELGPLKECVLELCICSLQICTIGITQTQHRFSKSGISKDFFCLLTEFPRKMDQKSDWG